MPLNVWVWPGGSQTKANPDPGPLSSLATLLLNWESSKKCNQHWLPSLLFKSLLLTDWDSPGSLHPQVGRVSSGKGCRNIALQPESLGCQQVHTSMSRYRHCTIFCFSVQDNSEWSHLLLGNSGSCSKSGTQNQPEQDGKVWRICS